ncbi:hypothetical protein ABBQ38_010563 [Trebouxia sp. C0009 RCD-2024]
MQPFPVEEKALWWAANPQDNYSLSGMPPHKLNLKGSFCNDDSGRCVMSMDKPVVPGWWCASLICGSLKHRV